MYFVSVLFQADLETQRLIWKRQSRTTTDKIKLFIVRTTLNIFVFAVLGGSLYLIYYTNDQMLQVTTIGCHDNYTNVTVHYYWLS
jgi:hypothetical protein